MKNNEAMKQWSNSDALFHCFIVSLFGRLARHPCYTVRHRGYITLISVLVVGAVGGAIGISLILLGLGASRTSFAFEQSVQAKSLADACAEEALQAIHDDNGFAGSGALSIGYGTCTYAVSNGGGQNRMISTTSTVGTIVRKTRLRVDQMTPSVRVASWQEVAD